MYYLSLQIKINDCVTESKSYLNKLTKLEFIQVGRFVHFYQNVPSLDMKQYGLAGLLISIKTPKV